jgi:hypothetical protein
MASTMSEVEWKMAVSRGIRAGALSVAPGSTSFAFTAAAISTKLPKSTPRLSAASSRIVSNMTRLPSECATTSTSSRAPFSFSAVAIA